MRYLFRTLLHFSLHHPTFLQAKVQIGLVFALHHQHTVYLAMMVCATFVLKALPTLFRVVRPLLNERMCSLKFF